MAGIAVVEYGMGNIRSILNGLNAVEGAGMVVSDPAAVAGFDKVILPGVGAFREAMAHLDECGMRLALEAHVAAGKPLLGICLGAQLICTDSDEGGHAEGLGWIPAHVERLPGGSGIRVPHMGWNTVCFQGEHPLLAGLVDGADVYFVHSHAIRCTDPDHALGVTTHGIAFASIVCKGNVFGMQFHPEKSQETGLQYLRNFVAL